MTTFNQAAARVMGREFDLFLGNALAEWHYRERIPSSDGCWRPRIRSVSLQGKKKALRQGCAAAP
jgi:hypothetical protein